MAQHKQAAGPRPGVRTLRDPLRNFLTPALWKQAHCAHPRRRAPPRWAVQPLVLVLLCLSWAAGDSQAERFETAKGFVTACLPKRRRPGKTAPGFPKALARLPLPVLRAVATAVRAVRAALLRWLALGWLVAGFVPLGCDGTRLECPRTEELERRLGQAGKPGSAPTLWLTALVHLRLGVPWAWRWGKGTASERGHLRHLLGVLPAAARVVADAGYVGYDLLRARRRRRVSFLIRMSCQATFYTERGTRVERFRDGRVYYWPPTKRKGSGACPPLPVRLLRVRGRGGKRDVWLATDVLDRGRLPLAQAGRFYRLRWESEGFFRTYKRTLAKVKLRSRTVRLVHREAEGAMLAAQLLAARGALALRPRCPARPACSARKVLVAIREELQTARPRRRKAFGQRLAEARREQRRRRSAKEKRVWPRRGPHEPPKPPRLLTLGEAERARILRHQTALE
jgi:hypothetical protein